MGVDPEDHASQLRSEDLELDRFLNALLVSVVPCHCGQTCPESSVKGRRSSAKWQMIGFTSSRFRLPHLSK
jgi:hypothetical protein